MPNSSPRWPCSRCSRPASFPAWTTAEAVSQAPPTSTRLQATDATPKVIARLCQRSAPSGSVPQIYQGDRHAKAYTRHDGASTAAASIQVMPPDAHIT